MDPMFLSAVILAIIVGATITYAIAHHRQKDSNKSRFIFNCMFFSDFILSKFNSFFDKPPNMSIKRLSDLLSPPLINCFSFHQKKFSAEIISINQIT